MTCLGQLKISLDVTFISGNELVSYCLQQQLQQCVVEGTIWYNISHLLVSACAEIPASPSASKMKAAFSKHRLGRWHGWLSFLGPPSPCLFSEVGISCLFAGVPAQNLMRGCSSRHSGVTQKANPELCNASVASCSAPTKEVKWCLAGVIYWFVTCLSAGGCLGCVCQALAGVVQSGHCPDWALLCSAVPSTLFANSSWWLVSLALRFIQSPPLLVGKGQDFQW